MKTILGPFHPYLEDALVDEILRLKEHDALSPLLVVLPSDALRRRIQICLAQERHLFLLNVQLLTFDQLSLRILAEMHSPAVLDVRDELFFVELLRQLIRMSVPGSAAFVGIEARAGGCSAVWQTLRDLRDAAIEPEVALEALQEGHFTGGLSQRTSDVLGLLQAVRTFCAEKKIYDRSELVQIGAQHVSRSKFLAQFREIFYYGFYDLTQTQLEFFEAVTRTYPATLFFPLLADSPPHPGWDFAARFYERYLQGRSESVRHFAARSANKAIPGTFALFDDYMQRSYEPPADNFACTVFNAFGIHDEIATVAKEILRLVDDTGIEHADIGVVARTLDDYGGVIKEIFSAHQIPIAGEIDEPLVQFPLTKAVIGLLNLPAQDYLRPHVIDLLSSSYFRFEIVGLNPKDVRPDLWDAATRELAICSGASEWERLHRYSGNGLLLSQRVLDEDARPPFVSASQIRALITVVNNLRADLNALPRRASWAEHVKHWQELLGNYLGVDRDRTAGRTMAEQLLQERILFIFEQLSALDQITTEISLSEFCETFQHWLGQAVAALTPINAPGVTVANATTARGLRFRALFIVGMNEGRFPRVIREDAFLRDRDREIIERDLGYKISQKLAAFDEEKLLFTLLVNSAAERLYCSFQRSDEGGRVLAPSWYLNELRRILGNDRISEQIIPRSSVEKAAAGPFQREGLLLPEELAIRLILAGDEAHSLIESANLSPDLFFQGLHAMDHLDRSTERLGPLDGMIEAPVQYWEQLLKRGLSPTALELYAICPYQYFARQVLGLERLERPEDDSGPSFAQTGELGHSILKLTYEDLIRRGYFEPEGRHDGFETVLAEAANIAFSEYAASNPTGYPLVWEILCETVTEVVRSIMVQDLAELAHSGYVPVAVEVDAMEPLPDDWQHPLAHLPIRGRMDRIDINRQQNRLRVVDYKFKSTPNSTVKETDLYRAALRGERLQPPLYVHLGKTMTPKNPEAAIEASFYYIAPRWREGPLVVKSFRGAELIGDMGGEIRATVAELSEGIRSGKFFMHRGDHCRYCEITEICRKNHPPSLWRAENDPETARHRRLRRKDPNEL